jgi:hypothetical protein
MPQRTVKWNRKKNGKAYRSRAIARLKKVARAKLRVRRNKKG